MAEVDATRACVVCGVLFARNGKVSLCSDECRTIRQRENERASALRNGYIKGPQQLTCAHCGVPFAGTANKTYCSRKCKDAQRRKTSAYARGQAKWRNKNRDAIRERGKQYKTKVRAERGRGDRSAEYGRTKIRRRKPKSQWLIGNRRLQSLTPDRIIGRILGMAPLKTHRVARLIAKADDHLAHMGSAERWRWKYHNDAAFREAQLQSIKASKLRRKKKTEFCMTRAQVLAVYAERSSCLYCGVRLERGEKVLDHMDPLSKGGAHDASNLVVACAKCNTRKSAKLFVDWLPLVAESRRATVAKVYARKHGAPAEQGGLMLVMKAA